MSSEYDDTYLDNPDDPKAPRRGGQAAQRAAQRAAKQNAPPDPQGAIDKPAKPIEPLTTSPIVVPTDLYDRATQIAHEIALSANIDEDAFRAMFFAIINQESGWNPNARDNVNEDGSKDRGIAQMNSGKNGAYDRSRGVTEQTQPGAVGWDRSVYNPEFALRWAAQHLADLYGQVPGSGIDKWRNAAAAYNGGLGGYNGAAAQAYATSVVAQARTPAGIQAGAKAGYDPGGTYASDIPGLTHEQSLAARRVADQDYIDILGRLPTPAEYADILAHGFTPVTLSDHLRAQPNPNAPGTTVGQFVDARAAAVKWANSTLGRDPTDSEITWLLENKVPINDESFSAFYEQVRDHAVWVAQRPDGTPVHPDDWRAVRDMIQKVWGDLGLQGRVDASVVNQAVAGRWTTSQARDYFRAQPAPGYPAGVTVGQVEQTSNIVSQIKSDLFPGEAVNETELKQFVGMTPEQIRKLIRDRPSKNVTGVTAGAERDTRTLAESFFKNAGIPNVELKPEDLQYLSLTGADPQAIAEYFSTKKDLVAKYPGLPYGLGSQDYQLALSQYADALASVFGAGSPMIADMLRAPRPGAPAGEREGSLVGAAMTSKVGAAEFGQTVEDFRQRTGRAPSGAEFARQRTAPQQRAGGQGASGNIKEPGTPSEERGTPRPAVGARA